MRDQKATILAIHKSHRTDAQNELISTAAEVAYEIQEHTGYLIIAWDENKEYVAWKFPSTNEDFTEYTIDTIKHWIEE